MLQGNVPECGAVADLQEEVETPANTQIGEEKILVKNTTADINRGRNGTGARTLAWGFQNQTDTSTLKAIQHHPRFSYCAEALGALLKYADGAEYKRTFHRPARYPCSCPLFLHG